MSLFQNAVSFELPYNNLYNHVHDGRTGHIWGDRYASKIEEGPPKDAEEYVFAPVDWKAGRRVRKRG
ncbi:MAG: hypothetical protein LBK61_05015 [Spirochaetaceae bacterium]|nr:hypothetical protein [Spirochaetaceae bacterium]